MTAEPLRAESPFGALTVADAMHHGIVSCEPATSLREVAAIIAENAIHSVVVRDGGGDEGAARVWGFVSDIALMRGLTSPVELRAGNLAALEVPTVGAEDTLEHAARLMAEQELAHLIVVAGERPAGVLSTLDVGRAVAGTSDALVR